MLPPLLAALRQSLTEMPAPRSDAHDALLAELTSIASGVPMTAQGVAASRSLGTPVNVCPLCQRPFAKA